MKKMSYRRWTKSEVRKLREEYSKKKGDLCKEMDRSRRQVRDKAYRLGLTDPQQIPNPNLTHQPQLVYILGVLKGDGYVYNDRSHHYLIGLNVTSSIFANVFKRTLETIGLNPIRWVRNAENENHKDLVVIYAHSKKFYEWYTDLSAEEIKQLVRIFPSSFLKGIYESDGSRGKHRLVFYNSDKELVNIIIFGLDKLNFNYSVLDYKRENRKREYRIMILGGKKERNRFLDTIKPCI